MSLIPDIDLKSKLIPFKTGKNKWSFRTEDKTNTIGIIPEDHNNFNKDISMKMIFGFDNYKTKKDCTLQDILKLIPTLKIREYTQETKLELLLSLVDAFLKGVKDGAKVADLEGYQLAKFGREIAERFKDPKKIFETNWDHLKTNILSDKDITSYVFNIPYIIYYTLLSTKTTNWYTLPFISDFSLKGNGYDGFTSSENVLNTLKGKNGFLDFVAPAFSVITTPTWKGMTSDSSVTYQIKFNLFNDTLDKAAMNYMFVNTLIQGNTPVQYGLFSQAPSLYDIQIEGGIRLFMCAGEFSYVSKGVSRLPPDKFYEKLFVRDLAHEKETNKYNVDKAAIAKKNEENQKKYESEMKEYNQQYSLEGLEGSEKYVKRMERENNPPPTKPQPIPDPTKPTDLEKRYFDYKSLLTHIKNEKLIRIPESYEVTLDFKSLLPNNLNNQLLQYAVKNIMEIEETKGTYQMSDIVNKISKEVNDAHGIAKGWSVDIDMSQQEAAGEAIADAATADAAETDEQVDEYKKDGSAHYKEITGRDDDENINIETED